MVIETTRPVNEIIEVMIAERSARAGLVLVRTQATIGDVA